MISHEQRALPERSQSTFGKATWITALLFMFINIVPITVLPILAVFFAGMYGIEIILAAALCLFRGRPRQVGVGLIVAIATTAVLYSLMMVVTWAS
ncbi:hypothetical protein [Nocardia sp. NBC_01329]|uniref:hypothetical protein n=1 Tax=Nocardia sp. NBC_01329 TaxID=2903594 RepID=UPI002E14A32C|nr:hypothetical protein OG405_15260 [Nocardia sp. NBC_01329]